MPFELDIYYSSVFVYLFLSLLVLCIMGLYFNQRSFHFKYGVSPTTIVASLGIFSLLFSISIIWHLPTYDFTSFNNQIKSTTLLVYLFMFVLALFIGWLVLYIHYAHYESLREFEFVIIPFFVILGIYLLLFSNDLMLFYIGIELQSLGLYILAASKYSSKFSTESGIKYFIFGAFASAIFLFGLVLIYIVTGLSSLTDIGVLLWVCFASSKEMAHLFWLVTGLFLVALGLAMKLGMAPFHMWLPDVYEGAPTIVTAFFSVISKVGLLVALFKFAPFMLAADNYVFSNLFVYLSLISVFLGSVAGLNQTAWKRLFAYSTISHTGFVVLGFVTNTLVGYSSVFFYLIAYLLMSFNLFAIFLSIRSFTTFKLHKTVGVLKSFPRSNPALAKCLAALLFSLAGIPPLYGFFVKFYAFYALISGGWLAASFVLVCLTVVSTVYYLRLIKLMFFGEKLHYSFLVPLTYSQAFLIALSFISSIFFSIYSTEILNLLHILLR